MSSEPRKRVGRRPGAADTRGAILEAARAEFAGSGYNKASIRGIARAAGVDPALVHHYFGTKEEIFRAAMELPLDPRELAGRLLDGDPDRIGERLTAFALGLWEAPESRDRLIGLIRSAVSAEQVGTMMREFITAELVPRVTPLVEGEDAALRVQLAAAQIIGAAILRYVIRAEPLASAGLDTLVARLGPVVQVHLAG